MMVASCYMNGDFCDAQIRMDTDGTGAHVVGGYTDAFLPAQKRLVNIVTGELRRLGAYVPPGGVKIANLGSDGHIAGTLPMQERGTALSCDARGRVRGVERLYAVDGSALPWLPSKHPAFTIMANAHRIGELVAVEVAAGRA